MQSEPWKVMPACHPLTAEVIIQMEAERVLSHFYEYFIVLQLKLNLVTMSSVSKTFCNRWNMKDWVKYCWGIFSRHDYVCFLREGRVSVSYLRIRSCHALATYIKDAFLPERLLLIWIFKNHLLPSSLLWETFIFFQILSEICKFNISYFCIFMLQRPSSLLGVRKTE